MKYLNKLQLSLAGFFLVMLLPAWVMAQDVTLDGKVTDINAEPLIGANVTIVGLGVGTTTNLDGAFKLRTQLDAGKYTVRVTYVGYKTYDQELEVTKGTEVLTYTYTFIMDDDAMNLDEVVVTGSTITSTRRQLGNSINTVSAEQLSKSGSGDALASLQGKVAGAQITQNSGDPAGGISVRLRGVNSIRGNSDPLYIIDGVVVSNSTNNVSQISVSAGDAALGTNRLVDLNPNDIADISVISGAAAAAQYGSRAANGVVLITTKRGASGKTNITFSTSVNANQLRKRVPINTYGKQFGAADRFLFMINPALATDTNFVTVNGRKLPNNIVDVNRFDYQDQIFQNGIGTSNNLSISGGDDKTRYFASLGYLQNEGIIVGTNFRRYNLRLNLDQTLSSWAKLSVGANFSNSRSQEMPNGNVFFSPINSMNITNNIFDIGMRDANGNLQKVEAGRVNPLTILENFDLSETTNRGGGNVKLSLFPIKGLRLDWITGVDAISQLGRSYIPVYPYTVNAIYFNNGFAGDATNLSYLVNSDVNLSYDTHLTSRFTSTTVAGYNYQYFQSDFSQSTGEVLSGDISTVNGAATTRTSYGLDRFAVDGFFLQETFGFDNQFFLTLAGRVDNSSKFSDENQNQFYPKVSASWVVSDLGFWNNVFGKHWSGLKLRASWGEAGGLAAINSYDRFWRFNPAPYLGKSTLVPSSQFANPDVRPERTEELEFGADLSLINNRVNLGVTVYNQTVTDLVVNRILATTSGAGSIVNNLGEMTNKGVELNLGVTAMRSKDFEWTFNAIYSKNKNKVTKVVKSPSSKLPIAIPINNVLGAPAFIVEGEAAGVFFGTYAATDANGNIIYQVNPDGTPNGLLQTEKGTAVPYVDGTPIPDGSYVISGTLYTPTRDANGQPTGGALRKIIGDPNPDFTASFGTNLTWKKLSFGVLFDGVYGNDVFNADKRTRQGVGLGDIAEKELRGELPRGWIWAMYPVEEWRIDDGSFTKLREISLGWNFGKIGNAVSDLNLTLVGRNLYSWDNYNGFDPETNAGGNSDLLRGTDFGNVPIPRTYQATLTAKF